MNKIERKKLILIIAAIITALMVALVVFLSTIKKSESDSAPTPEPVITVTPEPEPEQPSNDSSNDIGYIPLPEGYVPENPKGTVYDDSWVVEKTQSLLCELSNKNIVTEEILEPLKAFRADTGKVRSENTESLGVTVQRYLNEYEGYMGQPVPERLKNELNTYCGDFGSGD